MKAAVRMTRVNVMVWMARVIMPKPLNATCAAALHYTNVT